MVIEMSRPSSFSLDFTNAHRPDESPLSMYYNLNLLWMLNNPKVRADYIHAGRLFMGFYVARHRVRCCTLLPQKGELHFGPLAVYGPILALGALISFSGRLSLSGLVPVWVFLKNAFKRAFWASCEEV